MFIRKEWLSFMQAEYVNMSVDKKISLLAEPAPVAIQPAQDTATLT